jgi:hypothetical protein
VPLLLLVAAGCHSTTMENRGAMNGWIVQDRVELQRRAGILRESTIYPYYFEVGSAELNDLGRWAVGVLAEGNGGAVNVRRDDAPDDLYEVRVSSVESALVAAGATVERFAFEDGVPGGRGLPSERCLVVLGRESKAPAYPAGPVREASERKEWMNE